MPLAAWALLVSCLSLFIAGASLSWQVHSSRRARRTQLEVRFGRLPYSYEEMIGVGIEVVNHSDFPVRVQDVQLVFTPADEEDAEPLIVGLSTEAVPGTIEPHDSGFAATGVPDPAGDEDYAGLLVYANALTAVGNVASQAFDTRELPPFPAPMRFSRLFPDVAGEP